MRCSSYCTAGAYDISALVQKLIDSGFEPQYFDDVIYIQKSLPSANNLDIFFFPFGSVVIWGGKDSEEKAIFKYLDGFEREKLSEMTMDKVSCIYDPEAKKTCLDEEKNTIVLHEQNIFMKLSVSYATAQSVKLATLERSVGNILENTMPIQKELAEKGSMVSLSKKEITKKIGALFSERYLVNLHSDVLDTPEFFWRRPSYEPIYLMAVDFYDITLRQNALNHRLKMIQELYSLLSDEINHIHSSRLEWIVIILITIEVIIGLENHGVISKIIGFFQPLL
jgi:uncharacterized Rmd1/YagE family protein